MSDVLDIGCTGGGWRIKTGNEAETLRHVSLYCDPGNKQASHLRLAAHGDTG